MESPYSLKRCGRLVNALILICAIVAAMGLAEIVIRFVGHYDKDGTFLVFDRRLKPFALPLKSIRSSLLAVQQSHAPTSHIVVYDPVLGWTFRPHSQSDSKLYRYDKNGIRTGGKDYSKAPEPGVIRISLFGDSFTHGDDVAFSQTWGRILEELLRKHGVNAEVVNFGVRAYGIDQAFLRWEALGVDYSSDIVIFGFQPENMARNVNIFRPFFIPGDSGFPFSKPRFVLSNDSLELINSPCPSPTEMLAIIDDIFGWKMMQYEHWCNPADYESHFWNHSKLLCLGQKVLEKFRRHEDRSYYVTELQDLAFAITRAFSQSVHRTGADFVIVYLPSGLELQNLLQGRHMCDKLLHDFGSLGTVIDPSEPMYREMRQHGTVETLLPGHYSALGNRIVAESVFAQLEVMLASRKK